jgi:hypothetical protein
MFQCKFTILNFLICTTLHMIEKPKKLYERQTNILNSTKARQEGHHKQCFYMKIELENTTKKIEIFGEKYQICKDCKLSLTLRLR